ncbi:MAG: hypothetical protein AAF493_16910 [Pseudomonadota bacterium]
MESFDPLGYAREEIQPLVQRLCELTEAFGADDQLAYFTMLLNQITNARDPLDLANAFANLSTSAFMGFDYEPTVLFVLDEVLARAEILSETLSVTPDERH